MITYQVIGPQLMAEFRRLRDAQHLYDRSQSASIVMCGWYFADDRVHSTSETIEAKEPRACDDARAP